MTAPHAHVVSAATHIADASTGKIDLVAYTSSALERCEKIDASIACFTIISNEQAMQQATLLHASHEKSVERKPLVGLLVSIKDNLCVQDIISAAGSRILGNYAPVFDATVVARLKDAGAIIIGKTSMDEFGFGSFNTNTGLDYRVPKNPLDHDRVTGGSSGGAAAITAALAKEGIAHVAIAESTGGSIENPASFCGVIGYCPTYGLVSRNGLISYANSLDKIGIMSAKAADIAPVLAVIAGHDAADGTSLRATMHLPRKVSRVAVIKESVVGLDAPVAAAFAHTITLLKKSGIVVEELSLPTTFEYGISTYYIIATCEASTNLACLSGLRYGQQAIPNGKTFSEYFTQVRSEHFGEEAKRRIMLGTFARMAGYRDAYYLKATKVRTLIIDEYKQALENYDLLLTPTMPVVAPRFDEVAQMTPLQQYLMDILTVGPNLAGVPHASVPIGVDDKTKMPIGMMAIAAHLHDATLLAFLEQIEQLHAHESKDAEVRR